MLKKGRLVLAALAAASVLGLFGCGKQETVIQVASKPMTESYILTEMLKQLIERDTDYTVEITKGVGGGTSNIQPAMEAGEFDRGIALCGSGNGVCMTVNKHQGIRGALCWTVEIAWLARLHNDANVCCLPARFIPYEDAQDIVERFLATDFEGGRHQRRIEKIPLKTV